MSKVPWWIPLALAAVAVRVLLIVLVCLRADISLGQWALLHDGWEYMRLSQAIWAWDLGELNPEHLRFFPLYPLVMAPLSQILPIEVAGLSLAILCAVVCAVLTAHLGNDRRLAWWLVAFTPSWLMYTSTVMSEALSVALTLGCLLMITRQRWAWAGLLAGLSTLTRPVGALLLLPLITAALRCPESRRRKVLTALATGLPFPLAYLAVNRLMLGEALRSVSGYVQQDAAWPLQSLVHDTLDPSFSLQLKILLWGTLALSLAGAVGLWRRWRQGERFTSPLLIWHVSALIFYVLIPSIWAFRCLDRFLLAIWPTTLIGLAPWLPRHRVIHTALWLLLSLAALSVAHRWAVNLSAVFPFAERALP
ncbi:hypothetical protein JXA47_12120 [Candidatus Sumerlaeota bacterium]|nr:hypothetical protein [Candidatus Sumerlaeota bacterium]